MFDQKLYTQGNEPDLLAAYTYIYTGRQDRTAERVRTILAGEYHTGRGGLPGNDDAGTMSSWYVWSAIGLYPLAGQPIYFIGSPIFASSTIHLGSGKTFTVRAINNGAVAKYVQSAELNGKPLHRAWLTHSKSLPGEHSACTWANILRTGIRICHPGVTSLVLDVLPENRRMLGIIDRRWPDAPRERTRDAIVIRPAITPGQAAARGTVPAVRQAAVSRPARRRPACTQPICSLTSPSPR